MELEPEGRAEPEALVGYIISPTLESPSHGQVEGLAMHLEDVEGL
jgi:hypothetical protein